MKKISVVIPVYNVEKYIEQCCDSIKNQTYAYWEAILVDDGSTDKSGEICDAYASNDSRFIVIHQENARIAAARNKGLSVATGDYITFLDSDDFIEETLFETCIKLFDEKDVDVIQWDVNFHYDKEFPPKRNANRKLADYTEILTDAEGAIEFLVDMRRKGNDDRFNNLWNDCRCVWTKISKRQIFAELRFPDTREYEDDFISHRIFGNAHKVLFINCRYTNYRYRPNSTVHTMNYKGKFDKLACELDRLVYIEQREFRRFLRDAAHNYFTCYMNCIKMIQEDKKKWDCPNLYHDLRTNIKKYGVYLSITDRIIFESLAIAPNLVISIYKYYRKCRDR
jgi:glycosyltransferase involved in cell wall biosynthesis